MRGLKALFAVRDEARRKKIEWDVTLEERDLLRLEERMARGQPLDPQDCRNVIKWMLAIEATATKGIEDRETADALKREVEEAKKRLEGIRAEIVRLSKKKDAQPA